MSEIGGIFVDARELSHLFSSIYYHCHPHFTVPLSHSSVRALHCIAMNPGATVREVAEHLGCAHNTASEILRRLDDKKLISRKRRKEDERVVELSLTPSGRKVLEEHTGLDIEKLDRLLSHIPKEEKEAIFKGFSLLLRRLKEEAP
jgi:MarR family transcriptional regulator, organic hydroperoxide resistance regulator